MSGSICQQGSVLMPCREELNKFMLFKTSCFSQDLAIWLEVFVGSFLEGRKKTVLEKKTAASSLVCSNCTIVLQMNCMG